MNRVKTVARATLAAAAMVLLVGPAAYADNPAANPNKITIVIKSQYNGEIFETEYVDGQDTWPGWDDEACTPIPFTKLDYENNKIRYYNYDGTLVKTVNWTEWGKNPNDFSYQEWLDKKNAAASGSGSSGSTSGSTGSTGTKNTGTQAAAETPAATEPAPSPEVTSSVLAAEDPSPSPSPEVTESEDVAVTADDEAIEATPIAASNQSGLGRILLIALFITGVATFAVYEVLRRRPQRERA